MNTIQSSIIQFDLPLHLACPRPTEERNLARDEVRLLVSNGNGLISHKHFKDLGSFIQTGDVLVFNTSATIPAAIPITLPGRKKGRLHLSNQLDANQWLVEIRSVSNSKTMRWKHGAAGMVFQLPGGGNLVLKRRFYKHQQWLDLWMADFNSSLPVQRYLQVYGHPIQYDKLDRQYPLDYYQTSFSFHPGSSEMPSAGRGFTPGLIEKLIRQGISLVPILLHTGVSSLEENETPYPEYMEIHPVSASIMNAARQQDRRIIAIGTTAVRAVESATDQQGNIVPYQGNTELFIDDGYEMKIVDGLITGFHEPRASHLNMLQSIAGFQHIEKAYEVAIEKGYYWHQFGDLHLILP